MQRRASSGPWTAVAVALICGLVAPARADEGTEVAEKDAGLVALEETRAKVHDATYWLARRLDGWFGDIPFDEGGGAVKDGRLDLELFRNHEGRFGARVRFNVQLRLPNLERQAYAFIGRDNPRELTNDLPEDVTRQRDLAQSQTLDNRFFAGIGRGLGDRVDLRAGVHAPFRPFVQARYRQSWRVGERGVIDFRETVFLTSEDHLGSTTTASYERSLTRSLVLRWLNNVTISQNNPHFAWSSNLGLYKAMGEQRTLSLESQVSGTIGSGVGVGDYGVQAAWQQPLYQDWLLGEVLIGHYRPRTDPALDRVSRWIGGLYLKMRF